MCGDQARVGDERTSAVKTIPGDETNAKILIDEVFQYNFHLFINCLLLF